MASLNLISIQQVGEVQTNESLARYFHHVLGEEADQELERLYAGLYSIESVGNVVEAVLGVSYSLRLFDELLGFVLPRSAKENIYFSSSLDKHI